MKKILIILSLSFLFISLSAQKGRGLRKFKTYNGKDYLFLGVGTNYLFGDIGGANFENYIGITDWDFKKTRPSFSIGYQHDYNKYFGNRITASFSLYSGSDDNSRNERGYEYDANALEASFQFIGYIYRNKIFDLYAYLGFGGMYYNTNWKYLNNETGKLVIDPSTGKPMPGRPGYFGIGHNADSFSEDYEFNEKDGCFESNTGVLTIPVGIGIRFPIAESLLIGAEAGWSCPLGKNADYIDGISTPWSDSNDVPATIMFVLTYQINNGDDCYSKYGKGQFRHFKKR